MQRVLFFIYGVAGHLVFLGVFTYMAGFVGNLLVPKSIDTGPAGPVWLAVLVNLGLVALFGLQHSIMARPAFKEAWTRVVPNPIERSTYVWISNLLVILLMWQWRPIDIVVWNVEQPLLRGVLWGLFAAGWLLVPVASLLINHFDLFGTRQVWLHLQGRPYEPLPFRTPLFYKYMRHPLYVGWFMAFWCTPTMTVGHLLFAGSLSLYIVIATRIEERDLVAHFGQLYSEYRRRVPMFFPRLSRKVEAKSPVPARSEHG